MNCNEPVITFEQLIRRHVVMLITSWTILAVVTCIIACSNNSKAAVLTSAKTGEISCEPPTRSEISIPATIRNHLLNLGTVTGIWMIGIVGMGYEMQRLRRASQRIDTMRASDAMRHMTAMRALAGELSQDLNNLFAFMGGYSELLSLSLNSGHENAAYARHISESVKRGSELTRRFLEISGKQETKKRPDDLNVIVANLDSSIQSTLCTKIDLTFDLCQNSLPIFADRCQIQQVLTSILTNAKDASGSGGRIKVTTENVSLKKQTVKCGAILAPGSYGAVTVTDNGHGMDENTVSRIFEPFFTTREIGKWSGLGLSISLETIKKHNGQISVESSQGNGSRFTIYLPLLKGAE